MSGGVDSSVAAYLLKEQGYDVIGITMRTHPEQDSVQERLFSRTVEDAQRVASTLGIPYDIVDFQAEFQRHVVDYFAAEYLQGKTPNPCVMCNRFVKWEALLKKAFSLGAEGIATGHYARICRLENGRYTLRKSASDAKDQTYALYNLTQFQLSHTQMPVGAYPKEEIRKIARQIDVRVSEKQDSQEICFIPDNDYPRFIRQMAGERVPGAGNFVTQDGEVVGRHRGIIHYTIGQRKGLNLSMGHPVFVTEIRPETNEVVIGESEDVFQSSLVCDRLNVMAIPSLDRPMRLYAKVRYAHKGAPCLVTPLEGGRASVVFDRPQRAITPGQAVVFYEGECVVGGGTICSV